jgi:cell division protein FtsQ
VAGATVTHVLPSRIRIAVRERTPAVIVQAGSHSYLVDGTGAVLQEGAGAYPLIAALPLRIIAPGDHVTQPAFGAAMAVLGALPPELKSRLASVSAPSADLVSVALTDKTTITYGTSEKLADKNYAITTLLATGKPYASIDVRSPTHPAAAPR